MKDKKRNPRRLDPKVRAELEERYGSTTRLLEERIAYHRAKMADERDLAARRAARPRWRQVLPF